MAKQCYACGKKKISGGSITHRGLAKKKGGIGLQLVKNVNRTFKPNLQTARIKVGTNNKKVTICVACLRSGVVEKA